MKVTKAKFVTGLMVLLIAMLAVTPVFAQDGGDEPETPLVNAENLVTEISPMTYDIVSHTLTVGFSVMVAALFFFVLTARTVAPRFRLSSVLSVVVMVSAFLILYFQAESWQQRFVYDTASGMYVIADGSNAFSNGFRYLNWLIDVPMLLFQILFIVDITRERRASLRNQFWFSGSMMIITGYIGQFYEAQASGIDSPFYIFFIISSLFFLHVLYLIYRVIQEGKAGMSPQAASLFGTIWPLFLISWFLYPIGYLMPVLFNSEGVLEVGTITEFGIAGRAVVYTVADVASKVVYGVILATVAVIRSKDIGWTPDGEGALPEPSTAIND